ncbi:alcohol dehydrogenase catalytic domain-containing protein [Nocardioides sp. NPDC127503]|uniref:zinc-dependent alcohol dehydrogenase n=1 Tax=Nocardioides sp. NPDC127503 TaxID=3154516 RepID=UPI0033179556
MQAWEVSNNRLALHDVEPPTAGPGETVLDVALAGVCGSDIPKLRHPAAFDLPPVWRPGHEIVASEPVRGMMAVDPLISCGECRPCSVGDTHLCPSLVRVGWDRLGGYAAQICVPDINIHPIHDLHWKIAVLADPMAVAVHGLRCSRIDTAEHIAVIGAGAIGFLTAAYARSLGSKVTMITRHAPRMVLDGVRMASASEASAHSFDVVVDAASGASAEPLELALALVRAGGTVIAQNAYHPGITMTTALRDIFRRSLRIIGSFSFCQREGSDFAIGLDVLRRTPEAIELIDTTSPLEHLAQLIDPDSPSAPIRHVLAIA